MVEVVEPKVEQPRVHKVKGGHQCEYTRYTVRRPEGQMIQEERYIGTVEVPLCVANTLNELDQNWQRIEQGLFISSRGSRVVAQLRE